MRKLSGAGIFLEPGSGLRENQYVYTSVMLKDGPQMALAGLVVSSDSKGVFIQWSHSKPSEEDHIDRVIQDYLKPRRTAEPAAPPASPPSAPPPPKASPPPAPPPAGSPAAGKAPAPEGAMDVTATIRKKARKVRASDLASRVEMVDVLDLGALKGLIKEAVDESVALLEKGLGEGERRRILEEAEEAVKERIEIFKAEKAGMEESVRLLGAELAKTQALLEEERTKVISASQFTVSDQGMVELETRMGRMLGQAIKKGHADPKLAEEMRQVLLRLLDDERQKISQQAEEAQSARIALLEKKVGRLASSLQSAETERDHARRRADVLEASGILGLRNISTAGLDTEDPDRERKLELLKEIVQVNRDMRSLLKSQGRLPAMRARPAPTPGGAPAAKAPPEPAPVGPPAHRPPAGEGAAGGEGPEEVPQLATGEGADPDDLPWEPRGDAPREVKIRKLGRGGKTRETR